MGRQERVNPREGAEMIAYLKKQTGKFGHQLPGALPCEGEPT
jgi:hypothetical protein